MVAPAVPPAANRNQERQCSICFDPLVVPAGQEQQMVVTTRCHHHFHNNCLAEAYRVQMQCPECRTRGLEPYYNFTIIHYTRAHPDEDTATINPALRPAEIRPILPLPPEAELNGVVWDGQERGPLEIIPNPFIDLEPVTPEELMEEEPFCCALCSYVVGLVMSVVRCFFAVLSCQGYDSSIALCTREIEALPVPSLS